MKKASMKKSSMKAAKKTGMKRKAMKKSVVAKGKRAKSSVFRGTKARTVGGLKKSDLVRNKNGKVVSRKASENAKKNFKKKGLDKWFNAVKQPVSPSVLQDSAPSVASPRRDKHC